MSALRALAAFELRRAALRPGALLAYLVFGALLAIGHWDHWRGNAGVEEGSFFVFAHAAGAIMLMRYGLAADRRLRFDEYLIANHVRPGSYLAGKVLAIGTLLLLFGLVAASLEVVLAGGGVARAAWLGVTATLVALLFAPFAMFVEAWVDTEMAAAVVLLVYLVALFTTYMVGSSTLLADLPGFSYLDPGDWASLGPLALRSIVGAPVAFVLVGALARLNLPRC